MTCEECGHRVEHHGDRALWPACEAVEPVVIAGVRRATACECKGFRSA